MSEFLIDPENDRFSLKSFFLRNRNSYYYNYLDLSFKSLGDGGLNHLIESSVSLKNIDTLYLGTNQLTFESIKTLSNFLINPNKLIHLSLESNYIGNQGCLYLSFMLRNNSSLKSLIIGGNLIEDQGACYISKSLQINNTLKNLVLVNNNISQVSLSSFIDTLKLNKSLSRFSLGYRCSYEQGLEFNSIFDKNTSLIDCLMDFEDTFTQKLFSYNLNFNRYLIKHRQDIFNVTALFFTNNFLIGFYKRSNFYKILPLELSVSIANFAGVNCQTFITKWEKESRLKWKRKYSHIYK